MLDESASTAVPRFADVRWFDEVDSTNSVAADLAGREGVVPAIVVVADHQRAGRGRLGRPWEAPAGSSLLVSVVLPPATPDRPAHLSTIAMALAAADACEETAGVRPRLKWPNDLLVDGGKLGGILGEAVNGAIVVGLGLNVNWSGVAPPATGVALDRVAGRRIDRRQLLDVLLRGLDGHLASPWPHLLEDYRASSATVGQQVRVQLSSGTLEGVAVAITSHGHLLVVEAGREHVVAAGDVVHVRPAAEFR